MGDNLLAVAQAIANRSIEEAKTFAEAKYVMNGRLGALVQAYRALAEGKWVGASLREIVDRQVALMSNRVNVTGCDVTTTRTVFCHSSGQKPAGRVQIQRLAGASAASYCSMRPNSLLTM